MKRVALVLVLAFAACAWGQVQDAPIKMVSNAQVPLGCTIGTIYYVIDDQPGRNLNFCTAPNTWVQQPGAFGTSFSAADILCANTGDTGCTGHVATSETLFAQNFVLPANFFWKAGKAIKVTWTVMYTSSVGSPSITWNLRVGTTKLQSSLTGAWNSSVTSRSVLTECIIQSAAAPGATVGIYTGCSAIEGTVAQPVNVATNAAQTLQLSWQYGAGTAGNWVYLTQFVVEELN